MTTTKISKNGIDVCLATTLDDIMKCFSVRSAAFIARGEPFAEEFDHNDFVCATHLLAYDKGVPVGTMRVRILSTVNEGIATWERLAVLPTHRGSTKILFALANRAMEYCTYKQIHRIIGSVEDERLIRFWERFGFTKTNEPPLTYNGTRYIAMGGDFDPPRMPVGVAATCGCEEEAFTVWLRDVPATEQHAA